MTILSITFLTTLASVRREQSERERDEAHLQCSSSVEHKAKVVKKARRIDKIVNMDTKIADGSWENTKQIRSKWNANPACLLDKENKLRGAADRAAGLG